MSVELDELLAAYKENDKRLDVWRRYPDLTETEDAFTDYWACEEVSREFAAFARSRGWESLVIHADGAQTPFADYHYWVRLIRPHLEVYDVDWTARQYHNLHEVDGHDPAVLDLPWPLVWNPLPDLDAHPIAGVFDTVRHLR